MKKPDANDFEGFARAFREASAKAGKKQYLVPYFIASHPGSDLDAMIDLAVFLKRNGYRPDQVQDFIPAPFDIATCMYYTGLDPFTGEKVSVAKHLRDRKLQRALLQFFKPENYFEVRKALLAAGPIGPDRLGLRLPDSGQPPKAALEARRAKIERECGFGAIRTYDRRSRAGEAARRQTGRRRIRANRTAGYRPHRKSARSGSTATYWSETPLRCYPAGDHVSEHYRRNPPARAINRSSGPRGQPLTGQRRRAGRPDRRDRPGGPARGRQTA